jgi:hypothetical protein
MFVLVSLSVIRASVPKMELDTAFEQKNEIAKAVEEELEKVFFFLSLSFSLCCQLRYHKFVCFHFLGYVSLRL